MLIPELAHFRGVAGKALAARVILSQVRVVGLFLSPGAALLVGAALVALNLAPLLRPPPLLHWLTIGAHWALLLGMVIGSAAKTARPALRRALVRSGVRVCLECGYDLRGIPSRCPECSAQAADLAARAWEPIPETALYPALGACGSTEEERAALDAATRRAGLIARHRRASLLAVLVLLTIFWIAAFLAADALAAWNRADLPPAARSALINLAVASYPLAAAGWYTLIVRLVRREIEAGQTESRA